MSSRQFLITTAFLGCLYLSAVKAGGCWRNGILNPRRYNYHNRWHGSRDAFDLVSDMLSVPIYFNSLLRPQEFQPTGATTPRYSISKDERDVVELAVEIPGVEAKDVTVELENGNMLRIHGIRKSTGEGSEVESEFDRVFRMDDDIDVERLKVTLRSGILRIRVPKKAKEILSVPIILVEDEEEQVVETKNEPPTRVESVRLESDGLTITDADEDTKEASEL